MPAHSRSKNGVASLAYVAGIHVLMQQQEQRRGWHRISGLPEIRKYELPQVGQARLTVTSPAMTGSLIQSDWKMLQTFDLHVVNGSQPAKIKQNIDSVAPCDNAQPR
jgi:hypothetical protein